MKSLSYGRLYAIPWTAAYQAPPSMGFSRQEYWSGVPLPSLLCSLSWPIKELPEGLYVELLLLGIVLPGPRRVLRLSQVIPGSMSNPGGSGPLAAWPNELCVCVFVRACVCVCMCVCLSTGTSIFHQHQKTDPFSATTFLQLTKPLFGLCGRPESHLQQAKLVFREVLAA